MSLNATFSYYFTIVQAKKGVDGKCPVYLRITIEGNQVDYSTKVKVSPSKWLGGKKLSADKSTNSLLRTIERKLLSTYNQLVNADKRVTAQLLKDELLGIKQKQHTIISTAEYHNNQMEALLGKKFSFGTYKNYKTTLKYLKEFVPKQYKVKDILLSDLTYKFVEDFEFFLTIDKNCSNNGVMKQVQRLRKIVNMAVTNDWLDKNPFIKFKIHYDRVDRGYLTLGELRDLQAIELGCSRLKNVRDYFMFSCYTGLSYIDVKNLSPSELHQDDEGNWWIIQTREKTNIQAQIPLLQKAMEILERHFVPWNERIFPVVSNQKTNQYLKELGTMAGISKKLHYHLARHTFATTIALSNNVPLETVSKILGHTKISTTQVYARILKGKILSDVKGLDEIL